MGESPLIRVSEDFKDFLDELKREKNVKNYPDATNTLLRDLRKRYLKEEEEPFKMSFFG